MTIEYGPGAFSHTFLCMRVRRKGEGENKAFFSLSLFSLDVHGAGLARGDVVFVQ